LGVQIHAQIAKVYIVDYDSIDPGRRFVVSKILIVEDEEDLARTLKYNLDQAGYRATIAGTGGEALAAINGKDCFDLIVLDLMLPDMSGKDICREVRRDKILERTPIIMVTAMGTETDRVVGFEVGADDYVVKPFSGRELVLRVRALLKRSNTEHGESTSALEYGLLLLDPGGHNVSVEGRPISLTALEFRLLHTLVSRKERVQTRGQLLDDVWGYSGDVNTRTVDTHVRRLREKLGAAGRYIETIRGVGYCFRFRDGADEV